MQDLFESQMPQWISNTGFQISWRTNWGKTSFANEDGWRYCCPLQALEANLSVEYCLDSIAAVSHVVVVVDNTPGWAEYMVSSQLW